MTKRTKNLSFIVVVALLLYLGSYVGFRATHTEVWNQDGHAYVIFPQYRPAVYYFYPPLTYLDGTLTGMRFHLGPHR